MRLSLATLETSVAHAFGTTEHAIENAGRVGETLVKGAWDYSVHNPGAVLENLGIAVGTGAAVGAAMALFPECAIVGSGLAITGAVLGVVGAGSMVEQTYESFKRALPDLQIVWEADQHSKEEVAQAEKKVESDTGAAVTNLAIVPVSTVLGGWAGNAGARLALDAAGTLGTDTAALAAAGETSQSSQPQSLLTKLVSSQSSYFVSPSDIGAFSRGLRRFLPSAATTARTARLSTRLHS